MTYSIATILLVAFGILAAKRPAFALLVVTTCIPLYIVRLELGTIPTNLWELMIILLSVCTLVPQASTFLKSLRPTTWGYVSGVLLAVGLALGLYAAPDPREALGIIKGWFVIPMLYAACIYQLTSPVTPKQYGASIYQVADRFAAKWLPRALLLSTLPLSLAALWQVSTNHFITIDDRASAWFVSANYLALYLVPILLLSISPLLKAKGMVKVAGWIMWVLGLGALYSSFSFGGWIALAAGSLIYILVLKGKRFKYFWISLLMMLGLGVLAYFAIPRFAELFDLAQRTSASVRLQVWSTAWLMVKDHWLTGLGLGSFDQNYLSYAVRLFNPPLETMMLHPHNLFLQLAIGLGLPGFIGFVMIVIQWWRQLRRITDRYLLASLVAAMSAILLHGLVDTTYFKNDLAAIFWLLIGLAYVQTKLSNEAP